MLFLLQLLILTGFFVVPNDSMERHTLKGLKKNLLEIVNELSSKDENTLNGLEENLLEIVKELSLDDENKRNEGIYKMVKLFAGGKNAKKENEDFTIPAEKADEFLRKVFYALRYVFIMPKLKKMDKTWICATENQPKNSLKEILKGIFYVKFADQLEEYSKNFKPFLMILSVAIRICAIFGSEKDLYSLEAFLTAYKCVNANESQQPMIYSYKTIDCPTLTIYSYKILPIYKNNDQSLNFLSDKIASIKFFKTKTDSAKQNFNFLLKLSDVDVTPFAIVYLAEQIRKGIEKGMSMDINNMKIFELVGAHFNGYSRLIDYKKKKNPSASKFEASLKGEYFCLSNFLLNLLNRTLNLPNLKKYFVNTDLSKELSEKLKAKQSETGKFYDYHFKRYNQKDVESWKDKIVEHEHYLHFEEAIHINWNPNKEMFILIQLLKYRCFCPTRLYYFVDRFNKNLGEELRNDCLKMRESYELDGKILYSSEQIIAGDKQNKFLMHLETLENFGQIEKAYEKLKMFLKVEDYDKMDGYKIIVELNAEFGNAFKKLLEEI